VGQLARTQVRWVVEPLLAAGLTVGEVEALVFRLGFEAVVDGGRGTVAGVHALVAGEPPAVRTAWAVAVGRMIELEGPS
jgi:hypothetical protein